MRACRWTTTSDTKSQSWPPSGSVALASWRAVQVFLIDLFVRLVRRHPNIVNMHEVMMSETKIFLALELVTGGELFEHIAATGRVYVLCTFCSKKGVLSDTFSALCLPGYVQRRRHGAAALQTAHFRRLVLP